MIYVTTFFVQLFVTFFYVLLLSKVIIVFGFAIELKALMPLIAVVSSGMGAVSVGLIRQLTNPLCSE
jgi:hypothetical protein